MKSSDYNGERRGGGAAPFYFIGANLCQEERIDPLEWNLSSYKLLNGKPNHCIDTTV